MSEREKTEVLRHFSQEFLDSEVKRVKAANNGALLFEMDSWENPMLINFVLGTAEVPFYTTSANGSIQYIKGGESPKLKN